MQVPPFKQVGLQASGTGAVVTYMGTHIHTKLKVQYFCHYEVVQVILVGCSGMTINSSAIYKYFFICMSPLLALKDGLE